MSCESIIAHDHTHYAIKNYPRSLGAKAARDVSTEMGEIASIVLVPSTAASDYAHAAESLVRRQNFNPKVVYSDIWPNGKGFWALLFGNSLVGCLGLFQFMKRIIGTLWNDHCDYQRVISDLHVSIYCYDEENEAAVLEALKAGTLGGRRKHMDEDIAQLKDSQAWK